MGEREVEKRPCNGKSSAINPLFSNFYVKCFSLMMAAPQQGTVILLYGMILSLFTMANSEKKDGINARLIVSGFIQGVGYRAYVKQVAYRLKVRGTVRNLPDGRVEIYCNAPDRESYSRFKEMLEESEVGAVESIEQIFEGERGYGKGPEKWIGFNILRDESGSIEESLEFIVLGGRQMLGKQDMMLKKQDQMLGKQDMMLGKQDQTLEAIKDMHQDLKKDIKEMHHGIKDSITDMHQDMNSRFDWLAEQYGEFGETMKSINEKLDKISQFQEDFHEMKDAFIQLTHHLINEK